MISQIFACPAVTTHNADADAELFILLPVVMGVLFAIRRAWQADRLQRAGSPISWQFADSAARNTMHRVAGRVFITAAVAVALYAQHQLSYAIFVGAFAFDSLLCLIRAYRVVVRLQDSPGRLEHRGTWLCVDELYLHCGRRVWKQASELPTASAGLRRHD